MIERDDQLICKMSNGSEKILRVLNPGFNEGVGPIPPHYQTEVEELGSLNPLHQQTSAITYNISGHNARINHQSIDNSTNIVEENTVAIELLTELRQAIQEAALSVKEQSEALEIVKEVEGQFRAGKPKRSILKALLAGLPHAANISTIISTLLGLAS